MQKKSGKKIDWSKLANDMRLENKQISVAFRVGRTFIVQKLCADQWANWQSGQGVHSHQPPTSLIRTSYVSNKQRWLQQHTHIRWFINGFDGRQTHRIILQKYIYIHICACRDGRQNYVVRQMSTTSRDRECGCWVLNAHDNKYRAQQLDERIRYEIYFSSDTTQQLALRSQQRKTFHKHTHTRMKCGNYCTPSIILVPYRTQHAAYRQLSARLPITQMLALHSCALQRRRQQYRVMWMTNLVCVESPLPECMSRMPNAHILLLRNVSRSSRLFSSLCDCPFSGAVSRIRAVTFFFVLVNDTHSLIDVLSIHLSLSLSLCLFLFYLARTSARVFWCAHSNDASRCHAITYDVWRVLSDTY